MSDKDDSTSSRNNSQVNISEELYECFKGYLKMLGTSWIGKRPGWKGKTHYMSIYIGKFLMQGKKEIMAKNRSDCEAGSDIDEGTLLDAKVGKTRDRGLTHETRDGIL